MAEVPREGQGWDLGGGVITLSPGALPSTACNYNSASEGQASLGLVIPFFVQLPLTETTDLKI